jgi:bifunctional DNA-binding transcriptional regulator/antitoxin component of YhaV-PrlF toxin-antitoxin module
MSKGTEEVIALATVYRDGASVRGKIPAPVVKALRAKDGDVLAFERRGDGAVIVRKSNASERKGLAPKKGGKK